jgi:hypothetical protein
MALAPAEASDGRDHSSTLCGAVASRATLYAIKQFEQSRRDGSAKLAVVMLPHGSADPFAQARVKAAGRASDEVASPILKVVGSHGQIQVLGTSRGPWVLRPLLA